MKEQKNHLPIKNNAQIIKDNLGCRIFSKYAPFLYYFEYLMESLDKNIATLLK